MEGLSLVANGLAVVSVAFQLSEACIKLYVFWESIEDAPQEIAAVKEDLQYLISVFKGIENSEKPLGHCIADGVQHCRIKIADLMSIIEKFNEGFQSESRRRRLRTSFKAATHSKHLQRFRDSLNETKATLTLAMVHECVMQSLTYNIYADMSISQSMPARSIVGRARQEIIPSPEMTQLSEQRQLQRFPSSRDGHRFFLPLPATTQDVTKNALTYFEQAVSQQALTDSTMQELMLHAISSTAIATFQSTSLEIFAQDGYMMDECGQVRAKTFVYSESLSCQVRHEATSFRTALGCLWVRRTFISRAKENTSKLEKAQTVTSVVFYPTRWLQLMGLKNGFEAVMASAGRSWLYNCRIAVTRAVPEDAMIFELCLAGETRAVQMLLQKGQGSVVDTSPKGWKPLHFAAVAGHTDLCAMLIRAGADKSALVYEGPTESVLSPISLYVSHSTNRSAEEKIEMLRLYCDCIDLSDADSDGWLVHEWLKKAYATERKPISQNSITWLLHLTANEEYVEFSARNIWSALQHAVRSVLNHGRFSNTLERILDLSLEEHFATSQRHIDALGVWLALRVNGRVLLPMVLNAGSFLQMKGFDWIDDDMPHRLFLQALPHLYAAWCHTVLEAVEQVEMYMREEFHQCLGQLNMTRETFLHTISRENTNHRPTNGRICTDCQVEYSALDHGLVQPARIAVTECVSTGHSFDCNCQNMDEITSYMTKLTLPTYAGAYDKDGEGQYFDTEDEFFDAEPHIFDHTSCNKPDPFSDIATMLFRAHGRAWIGSYAIGEELCASCFLFRENYISKDGFAADFPPMPKSFERLRANQ
ncbi:uncharacterized protein M421DRAFT_380930 [Didymella exigua CBS 183.55]|uniref:Uncharacterized protein n=1 Tax=Didymella exigua CBS 183.55 TaxID=1150837 RepID=A0A6A5RNF0_9PLEO|nr:uncharacterized protein M421DRAFT_380930 [Didymella exigua CBS 183.55]KAF1929931.1 hypothetical protein M421DRAFT_380930 [Didymella exigua CBS 183.55]